MPTVLDPIERADLLKKQADQVLAMVGLAEIVSPYGEITPNGSYYLNAMAYPDIDVYIPDLPLETILAIGSAMLQRCEAVSQLVFERASGPTDPGRYYLKPRIQYGDWGRPWKIDIWSVRPEVIAGKMAMLSSYRDRLTPALREKILRYKNSILTADYRTPMSSGIYIYQAFIDQGLEDFDEVSRYLAANGIQV